MNIEHFEWANGSVVDDGESDCIYVDLESTDIIVSSDKFGKFLLNENEFEREVRDECRVSLDMIKRVVFEECGTSSITVLYELGLFGYIYRFDGHNGWTRHGVTRGYA